MPDSIWLRAQQPIQSTALLGRLDFARMVGLTV
jgi:hypothetical protein